MAVNFPVSDILYNDYVKFYEMVKGGRVTLVLFAACRREAIGTRLSVKHLGFDQIIILRQGDPRAKNLPEGNEQISENQ